MCVCTYVRILYCIRRRRTDPEIKAVYGRSSALHERAHENIWSCLGEKKRREKKRLDIMLLYYVYFYCDVYENTENACAESDGTAYVQ